MERESISFGLRRITSQFAVRKQRSLTPSKKKAAAHAYLALNRDNICAQKRAKYVLAEPKPDVKHM